MGPSAQKSRYVKDMALTGWVGLVEQKLIVLHQEPAALTIPMYSDLMASYFKYLGLCLSTFCGLGSEIVLYVQRHTEMMGCY